MTNAEFDAAYAKRSLEERKDEDWTLNAKAMVGTFLVLSGMLLFLSSFLTPCCNN